ncbi:unnamed protein product, partial [Prorocentrum cordatum]
CAVVTDIDRCGGVDHVPVQLSLEGRRHCGNRGAKGRALLGAKKMMYAGLRNKFRREIRGKQPGHWGVDVNAEAMNVAVKIYKKAIADVKRRNGKGLAEPARRLPKELDIYAMPGVPWPDTWADASAEQTAAVEACHWFMAVTKPILADQLRNDKKAYLASTTDDMNASAACRDSSKEWGHLRRHLRFGGRPSRRFKGGKLLPMQRDLNDRVIAADGSQAADAFAHSAQAEGAHKLDRATGCHRYNAAAHVDAKQ